MNRRKLILGLGTLTAGLAAASGSGAFSAAQIKEREANIQVVNDAGALIGLKPNPDVAGVNDDGGELTIDLEDPGINQNSTYQFGLFATNANVSASGDFPFTANEPSLRTNGQFDSAFLIANQTDNQQLLEIDYRLGQTDDGDNDGFDTSYWFEVHREGRLDLLQGTVDKTATVSLGSGEACGVSFLLDVPGDTLGEEISGSLAINAGEAISGGGQSSDDGEQSPPR